MIPEKCQWEEGWATFKGSNVIPSIDHVKTKFLDVHYGPDPLQAMDIYIPEGVQKPYPVFILIHGGGFIHCDKRDFHLYPGFFARERGYALVSLNYRLAPKNPYPDGINDVKNAIIWICDHVEEYGLDPHRLFLFGPSAGGNLTALASMQSRSYLGDKGTIRACAPLCPAVDLLNVGKDYKNIPHKIFATAPTVYLMYWLYFGKRWRDKELLKEASYMPYVNQNNPPTFLQIGDHDPVIPLVEIQTMYEQMKAVIGEEHVVLDIMPGAAHSGGDEHYFQREDIGRVLDFFDKYR